MNQQILNFDAGTISANTDPPTSAIAARDLVQSGEHQRQCELVLAAIKRWPGRTSAELAALSGLDRHLVGKRCPDLAKIGLAKQGPIKRQANGRPAVTWFAT